MESILITIRAALGVDEDYSGFDGEIILGINGAIFSLNQLGIGPEAGYEITGIEEVWAEILLGATDIEAIKSYIQLKTRLSFDPPTTSFLLNSIERQIEQLEWRLLAQVEDTTLVEE